jgi:predicted neuraminidase
MNMKICFLLLIFLSALSGQSEPFHHSQNIFPLQEKHVHGSSLVQIPNGDLLCAWFHGSGERTADDVVINGARLKNGQEQCSEIFLMADTPNLPDCNPTLFLDAREKLWLFWIAVRANRWEHSLLRYKTSTEYDTDGAPRWNWQDVILLKPGEEFAKALQEDFKKLNFRQDMWSEYARPYAELILVAAEEKAKRQEGWMTRNHPLQLQNGRILLPLYSDGFNLSLVAISEDDGATWRPSRPIVGLAGIQPSLVQKDDGTIVAFFRDAGGAPKRVLKSISKDQGETWSVMKDTDIPNPGSSLQVRELQNGMWAMIYNDTEEERDSLAFSLSDDEGETWKWTRHIGQGERYAYPSMIQDKEGLIHISYTYQNKEGKKTIRHDVFNVEWVQQGDGE